MDDGRQTEEESCLMAAGEENESIQCVGIRKVVWSFMDFPELSLLMCWFFQTGQLKQTVKLAHQQTSIDDGWRSDVMFHQTQE